MPTAAIATILPVMWLAGDWRLLLALGGGAGLLPKAPGTAGTLVAVVLYYALAAVLPFFALVFLAAIFLAAGAPLCAYADNVLQTADDRRIVWDEISAFFVVLLVLPPAWQWQAAAFVVFRLLDAVKPFPIGYLDQASGAGIMADDIAAAAATVILLHLLHAVAVMY